MEKGLLSIVSAVYNSGKYLSDCIDSVINQTYARWELILVNDGSTDNSLDICLEYASKDRRIKVYSQRNQGQSAAQNKGLALCEGEFIAFLDSDDTIEPETYTAAIKKLNTIAEIDFVQFRSLVRHYNGDIPYRGRKTEDTIIGTKALFDAWLFRGGFIVTSWCKVYRRSLFDGLTFKEGILFEDSLMSAAILLRARGMAFSLQGGYNFFVRSQEKEQWTERHSRDFVVSYGSILELLLSYRNMIEERCYFYRILCNYYCSGSEEVKLLVRTYFSKVYLMDIFRSKRLSLKSRAKILFIGLYCKMVS